MTILDAIRARAEKRPSHPALSIDAADGTSTRVSYAELVATFETHAKELTGRGVAPGDRCGLAARQGRGFVEAALGILAADACFVPISEDHRGAALDEFAARSHLHHLWLPDETPVDFRSFEDVSPVDGADDAAFRALSPAYLRFTSGTTSARKGVILGHGTITRRLDAANRGLGIGPDDRILWLLPMAHHFVVSILLYLSRGATILLPSSSLARTVLECAVRDEATLSYASPYHYRLLANDAGALRPRLRLAVSTAEGLREDVAQRFGERFDLPLTQALGIIEVGLPVVNLVSAAAKPTALGRPLPDYDVWLRGEDGRPAAGPAGPETAGEICIRGPGLLDAYLEPWLPAREVLLPDGFRTGDQGWFDADGDLHLVGRRATRISMAGMKFFGEEVEAVLDTHPKVAGSRVFGREHEKLGEIPAAEVVPAGDDPPTRAELMAHCRARLPSYKVPRSFTLVESLPVTDTGKLARRAEKNSH